MSKLRGLSSRFNGAVGGMFGLVGGQSHPQCRELLVALSRRKPLAASSMAALVQRSAMEASCQCLTLRQTQRTVPIIFSMMLVHASELRSSAGRPRRMTVRISSSPLEEAGGDAGSLLLQPAGKVSDQPLGLVGIVQSPRLTQHRANRSVQRLG